MKNLFILLCATYLFVSCGGDDLSIDSKKKTKELPELFVYKGEFFNAPNCEDIEGIEMRWINPFKFPEDTACIVKECFPNGLVKSWAGIADKQFNGERYIYWEGGTLNTVIVYQNGKQVNTKYYREDGTMYSQEENKNGVIDLTRMTYGLKGELHKTEIIENRSVVSCEGLDCPEL